MAGRSEKAGIFRISSGRSEPMPELRSGEDLKTGIRKKNQKKAQEEEGTGQQSVELKIPGKLISRERGRKSAVRSVEEKKQFQERVVTKSYTKCFDYDIIKSGLCIRYRRPGDELVIDSRGKRQKLKSYFINEKVPKEKRDRILLIAEEEQIVWIPGMRMSAAYQIGDQTTKILKIKIVEE